MNRDTPNPLRREVVQDSARKPLDLFAYSLMVLLCLIWGFQQVGIKATAADMPPVMQLAIRFIGSSIVYGVVVLMRHGKTAFSDGSAPAGLTVGILFAVEFLLLAEALRYTTSAHSVVFLYTSPVFTALGLQYIPEERLSWVQWLGIGGAVAGIALAFMGPSESASGARIFGDMLALLGGAAWGASTVVLRRSRLAGVPATKTILYQVFVAAIVLSGYTLVTQQARVHPSALLVGNLLFQTIVVAVLSYLGWFWLLRHYLTSRLMLFALLTPIFGVMFGAAILGDPLDGHFTLGTACVVAGIAVVNGVELLRSRR